MTQRRTWLHKAGATIDTWIREGRATPAAGNFRIETRRTAYAFQGGVCAAVERRAELGLDGEPSSSGADGMRLVGWLVEDTTLTRTWVPGARALLWRPGHGDQPSRVAVTSPAFAYVREALPRPGGHRARNHHPAGSPVRRGFVVPPSSVSRIQLSVPAP